MTLGTRRFLYITAMVLFTVSAPLLVLYTAGFRFDFYRNAIRSTGSLFIKTLPQDASVYINNNLVDTNTPLRLNHLTPNVYTVRIEKEGYHTWKKDLAVSDKKTTFAENIILWKTQPEGTELLDASVDFFSFDHDERYIIYIEEKTLKAYHLASEIEVTLLQTIETDTVNIKWSEHGSDALITIGSTTWLFDHDTLELTNLSNNISGDDIRFHPTQNQLLTFNNQRGIYTYSLVTGKTESLLMRPVLDYSIVEEDVYYITGPDPTILTRKQRDIDEEPPSFVLPEISTLSLERIIDHRAYVYDENERTLYILHLQPESFNQQSHILQDVDQWEFTKDGTKLLLFNEWEVSFITLDDMKTKVITRVSTPLEHVYWHADDNYIITVAEAAVTAIELDTRDIQNKHALWQNTEVIQATLSTDGEHIYLTTKEGDAHLLRKLKVTDLETSLLPL
ncbi:MAG: PEGA domain-containing protein [Patescibacteria group bacterium]